MDQPSLAYDDRPVQAPNAALAIRQQRIITSSLLRRLQLRRRAIIRRRAAFTLGCGMVGLSAGISPLINPFGVWAWLILLANVVIALPLLCFSFRAVWLQQDELLNILDLIEKNRTALSLLDTMVEPETERH